MVQQIGVFQLPQRLVDRNGYGIAQIKASCFLPHGDAYTAVKICLQKNLGQTLGLLAEKQVAIIGEFCFCIAPGGLGGQTPKFLDIVFGKEVSQVVIDTYIYQMPVVQSCPADSLFRNVKAQGTDQMQPGTGGGTGTGNVAAVL